MVWQTSPRQLVDMNETINTELVVDKNEGRTHGKFGPRRTHIQIFAYRFTSLLAQTPVISICGMALSHLLMLDKLSLTRFLLTRLRDICTDLITDDYRKQYNMSLICTHTHSHRSCSNIYTDSNRSQDRLGLTAHST